MSVRHLVAAAGVAAVIAAIPVVPSFATTVTDLYVTADGHDTADCSQPTPCATVTQAIFNAPTTPTTIFVGPGTFDGPIRPGAVNKTVDIEGDSMGTTTLEATPSSLAYDDTVVNLYGAYTTTMANLTVAGDDVAGIYVDDSNATLHLDHVAVTGGGCDLFVDQGTVDASDSVFSDADPSGSCGLAPGYHADVAINNGSLTLTNTAITDPPVGGSGLITDGGTTSVDQTTFDSSDNHTDTNHSIGADVRDGGITLSHSLVHGFGTGVANTGATTLLDDDTFQGNTAGVDGELETTDVVRSSFAGESVSLEGTVDVAGSLLGDDSVQDCTGTIADLGYNLASDSSCGFTAGTSQNGVDTGLDSSLSDVGGHLDTVALRNPSAAVDSIPVGATYGDAQTPLCPASGTTDVRGVPRPQGGACDAGSMELAGTVTTLTAPAKAKPGAAHLVATVTVPDVGVDGTGVSDGTVTFTSGTTVLCGGPVTVVSEQASCTASELSAGKRSVVASYTPADGSIVDASTSSTKTVLVGTVPTIKGPGKVGLHVGKGAVITESAAGQPTPTLALTKGKLPAGLHLGKLGTKDVLKGTPKKSAVGRHTLTFTATNLIGRATHTLVIVVKR